MHPYENGCFHNGLVSMTLDVMVTVIEKVMFKVTEVRKGDEEGKDDKMHQQKC